jgi:hypothetical protein
MRTIISSKITGFQPPKDSKSRRPNIDVQNYLKPCFDHIGDKIRCRIEDFRSETSKERESRLCYTKPQGVGIQVQYSDLAKL